MGSVVSSENEGPRCSYINEQGRRCWLAASHEDPMHRFNLAEPKGSGGSSLDKKCRCGHSRRRHLEGLEGGGSCVECTSAWAHAFVPKDAETAGEPKAPRCHAQFHKPGEGFLCSLSEEHEGPHSAPIPNGGTFNWDDTVAQYPIEPEAPEDEEARRRLEAFERLCEMTPLPEPPRRPPYAVAYAIEGGAQYEIALPGDATVRAVDGALVITHDKPVLAMGQVRPMEGA